VTGAASLGALTVTGAASLGATTLGALTVTGAASLGATTLGVTTLNGALYINNLTNNTAVTTNNVYYNVANKELVYNAVTVVQDINYDFVNANMLLIDDDYLYSTLRTLVIVPNSVPVETHTWTAISISESGQYQTAIGQGLGYIFRSANYGSTWTTPTTDPCYCISVSGSGMYQTAGSINGGLWFSTDYGTSFTVRQWVGGRNLFWNSVSISQTGKYQSAVTGNSLGIEESGASNISEPDVYFMQIWTSSDFGANWTNVPNTIDTTLTTGGAKKYWRSISVSLTGKYQSACIRGGGAAGQIWRSANYGVTFTAVPGTLVNGWNAISLSGSGQIQSAVIAGKTYTSGSGSIWRSMDFGVTWLEVAGTSRADWWCISLSKTGRYQVAIDRDINGNGGLFMSTNYGRTWSSVTTPAGRWLSASISGSGQYISVGLYNGNVYKIKLVALVEPCDSSVFANVTMYGTTSLSTLIVVNSTMTGTIYPSMDNTYNLGSLGTRWKNVYAATATIQTSDRRLKKDIADISIGLEFVDQLRPVQYKFIESSKEIYTNPLGSTIVSSIAGTRTHYGLIAQEVRSTMKSDESAAWILDNVKDPESSQGLRYTEFIAPMIKAIQDLHIMLKSTNATLESHSAEIRLLKLQLNEANRKNIV
jgi:hypothetical protein